MNYEEYLTLNFKEAWQEPSPDLSVKIIRALRWQRRRPLFFLFLGLTISLLGTGFNFLVAAMSNSVFEILALMVTGLEFSFSYLGDYLQILANLVPISELTLFATNLLAVVFVVYWFKKMDSAIKVRI